MRLDRFLTDSGLWSRREAVKLIRRGVVEADGVCLRDPSVKIDENAARVTVEGKPVPYARFRWLMLHKPAGTVSTTEERENSVMKLVPPEFSRRGLFPCGRLDIDTTGLLLLTDDGETAHALLSPHRHCEKTYRFVCAPLSEEGRRKMEEGIELSDFTSGPCRIRMSDPEHGEITLTEGKYHQIKRMFSAVGSEILALERISFAGIPLDPALAPGEWREMTEEEIASLRDRK